MAKLPLETRVRAVDRFNARGGRQFLFVVFDLPYFELIHAACRGASIFVETPDRAFQEIRGEIPHVSNPDSAWGSLGIIPPSFEIVEGARVELRIGGAASLPRNDPRSKTQEGGGVEPPPL
jgi:hypothetical protein